MSERNGKASAVKREMLAELKVMQRIEKLLKDLSPMAKVRVGDWTKSIAHEMAANDEDLEDDIGDVASDQIPRDDSISF